MAAYKPRGVPGFTRSRTFTQEDIDLMRELYFRKERPMSYEDIARMFRTSATTIVLATQGKLLPKEEE